MAVVAALLLGAADAVQHCARAVTIDAAFSNGFGFGGTNATLLFRRLT
jgi:3-oxoacyl-(acyl-carrier-protein) synthase